MIQLTIYKKAVCSDRKYNERILLHRLSTGFFHKPFDFTQGIRLHPRRGANKMRECKICGRTENLHKHHIVHGNGKRKACETEESLVDLCFDCHQFLHSSRGNNLDMRLKLQLQATYFRQGKTEEEVRALMGDKLYLVGGEIYGMKKIEKAG